ncbi:MAG: ATP-binding protein [Planctomycetia bacterium]
MGNDLAFTSPASGSASDLDQDQADMAAILADGAGLWASVCSTSAEYIAIVDRAGVIRFSNRVDDGFTIDQVIGHEFTQFTMPESTAALREALAEVLATGQERTLETTVRRLNGELNYFSLRIGPITRAGRTVAVLACCTSILPLRNTEERLRHERHVLGQLLEVQERERQVVSYEIHDGVAQYIAGALMHLEAFTHANPGCAAAPELHEAMRLVRMASHESRRLIGGLRPPALDELGIAEAIEALVTEARADVPAVEFTHSLPGPRLPPQMETAIFRIVQESLTNVRKHARAASVRVDLTRSGDSLRISVHDDGRGFDPRQVPADRFGLEGIRQRARLFGGEPRIVAAPGTGTTIEVSLPVPK